MAKKLLLLLVSLSSFGLRTHADIGGAKVTSVSLERGKATITVQNVSQHDITGFTLGLTSHFLDGKESYDERTEDYGPFSITGKALHPGDTSVEVKDYGSTLQGLDAILIVVIYDDQTAEVSNDRAFADTMRTRKAIARALQVASSTLRSADSDPQPNVRAAQDIKKTLQTDDTADKVTLNGVTKLLSEAPSGGEREFVHAQAMRLETEAVAFEQHAKIRRLP